MKKAGATNTKILQHERSMDSAEMSFEGFPQSKFRAPQLPHSAKSLSRRNMQSAKMIQTQTYAESGYESGVDGCGSISSSSSSSCLSVAITTLCSDFIVCGRNLGKGG
jgi:hypothetical protein